LALRYEADALDRRRARAEREHKYQDALRLSLHFEGLTLPEKEVDYDYVGEYLYTLRGCFFTDNIWSL
jgi:hypothetical protein